MDKILKNGKICITVSLCSFFISAFSLSFIPVISFLSDNIEQTVQYIIGAIFWIGLLTGIISFIFFASAMKSIQKKYSNNKHYSKNNIGIITFQKNILHILMYIIIFVGFIIIVFNFIFQFLSEYMSFPFLSIVFFMFIMHCITDGKYFRIYKYTKEGKIKNENK